MRGPDAMQEALFTFTGLEKFVPPDHPLRSVKTLVDDSLRSLDGRFNEIYAGTGRASIAPEKLLRALLLQVFYSVCSERMHGGAARSMAARPGMTVTGSARCSASASRSTSAGARPE